MLNGTIEVNDGGYAILNLAGNWINNGTITVHAGELILGDTNDVEPNEPHAGSDAWVNNGTISTQNTAVELGGWLTLEPSFDNLATLNLSTDTVYLIGTLDNDPADNPTTGGILTLDPGMTSSSGSWYLDGGQIDGGNINTSGAAALLCTDDDDGTLDGVNRAGSVQVIGGTLTMEGMGWENSDTIAVTDNGTLNLYGSWDNIGSISVDSTSAISLGSDYAPDPTSADAANYLWTNTDTIAIASGATVDLGGLLTTDTFDSLGLGAGVTVNLTGTLDNSPAHNHQSGGTLALNGSTGPLYLAGGLICRGVVTTANGNDLVATWDQYVDLQSGGGTLDGVTLDGTLDMTQFPGSFATVTNGLTLNGIIELGGASGTSNAGDLYFGSFADDLAQTISGLGTIQFGQDNAGDLLYNNSSNPLTFGPNITVQGGLNSSIGSPAAPIVNQGTIENSGGGSLAIQADLTNAGTIDPGTGTLTVTNFTQTPAGVLDIEIGGAGQRGQIAVTGNAALDGTLNITLTGGYLPNAGDSFQILSFGQVFGDFAAISGLGAGGDNEFSPVYAARPSR